MRPQWNSGMTECTWLSDFPSVALIGILLDYNQVAAEIHQRLMEEEKESQPADTKERSPQMGTNKKAKEEPPKKEKADKKAKGIHGCGIRSCGCFSLSLEHTR